MARRKKGRDIDGVVLLDKPLGCSSNAALQRTRRAFDARKAGHTGSLDPLATGLLPVCLGEATKLSSYLLHARKRYRVTACHGFETETGDREGRPTRRAVVALPQAEEIKSVLAGFMGQQQQIPPMYSALKHEGRRLYEMARNGQTVPRAPRDITVSALTLIARDPESFILEAEVSGGTYIRTLVEDIAASWGGRAHVGALRRISVGDLGAQRAMTPLDVIETRALAGDDLGDLLLPSSTLIEGWPTIQLDKTAIEDVCHGRPTPAPVNGESQGMLQLCGRAGELFGLGYCDDEGRIVPKRIFARVQR